MDVKSSVILNLRFIDNSPFLRKLAFKTNTLNLSFKSQQLLLILKIFTYKSIIYALKMPDCYNAIILKAISMRCHMGFIYVLI